MKKIIVPTDFSENAYNALEYAVQLFKNIETTFYLVHTYTPPVYQTEYVLQNPAQFGLGDALKENALTQLEQLKQKIESSWPNPKHTFFTHTAFNLLVDELSELMKAANPDLIVMGTQGATGAKEIFLGSHTVHVIKKASCPVIAVPSRFKFEHPAEILFPTDYEIEYQEKQLEPILEIAQNHISSVEVVHVSSGNRLSDMQLGNKKKLDHLLSSVAHLFHELPNQEVIEGINAFQLKKRMNLLVMIQNKHTFLERLFIEPIIKKIGFHVTIPFMVIPDLDE